MKRTCILILPICLAALWACGESGKESENYFNALGDSLLSASKGTYFRLYSDDIAFDGSLKMLDNGKEKTGTIKCNPLAFDLRVDHPLDPSISKTKVSLFGYNRANTNIILGGDFSPLGTLKLDIKPRLYVEDGTVYTDFSDASALRLALGVALKDYLTEGFPIKGKFTTGLPGGLSFDVPAFDKEVFTKTINDCYAVAPNAFAFQEEDGIKTVSFASTDKEQLRLILDAILPQSEKEKMSIYDSVAETTNLTNLSFAISFTSIGPTGLRFDTSLSFDENSTGSIQPIGTWTASGKMNFAYGAAVKAFTVEDKENFKDIPIDWEAIAKGISDSIS